jgi:hypothetical protein
LSGQLKSCRDAGIFRETVRTPIRHEWP